MISDIVNIWQLEDIGIFIVLSIGWAIADAAESLGFFWHFEFTPIYWITVDLWHTEKELKGFSIWMNFWGVDFGCWHTLI